MPHRRRKTILDAQQACSELREFTAGKSYDDLLNDRGLQLILERLFEVLGEALYRLKNLDEPSFDFKRISALPIRRRIRADSAARRIPRNLVLASDARLVP